MWYAVLRKRERGVFIGTLCIRHTDRKTLLEESGWEEVPIAEIGALGDVDRRADRDLVVELDHVGDRHPQQPCEAALPSE